MRSRIVWVWVVLTAITAGYTCGVEIYVDPTGGSDIDDGSEQSPKASILGALTIAGTDDTIILEDGIYSGEDNRDINVNGLRVTIRSRNGAENCVIDCGGSQAEPHRAFIFNNEEDNNTIIDGITIMGGYSNGSGGAIMCQNASPLIRNCIIINNTAINGGGIYYSQSNAAIISCIIADNLANGDALNGNGGGVYAEVDSELTIEKCMIYANTAVRSGGGVYLGTTTALLVNSLVVGNDAGSYGGGIYCWNSPSELVNCTISGNTAYSRGGALRLIHDSPAVISNCIFWDDEVSDNYGNEIAVDISEQSLTISHSDIEGGSSGIFWESAYTLNWDESNLDQDPVFAQPDADDWSAGDYSLLSSSACLDAGDNDAISDYDTDIAENTRVVNSAVDMGAYEFDCRPITISSFKAKANVNRTASLDSVVIKGTLDMTRQELESAESLSVTLRYGTFHLTFDNILLTDGVLKKGVFSYKNTDDKVFVLKLNTIKGQILVSAKKVDLTGMAAPVSLELQAGDYLGIGTADEDIINGAKPLDMKFLRGTVDALRVDKVKFKLGKVADSNTDSLTVVGAFAVADPDLDMNNKQITIRWGDFEAVIPADNNLVQKGYKYIYQKPKEMVSSGEINYIDKALFDLVKCSFKVQVKKTNIGSQANPAEFSFSFGSYNESVSVDY